MARAIPGVSRVFVADTTALVVFFTLTGILNERFVARMSWSEAATARLIGAPLMVATARPYGIWRDWVMSFHAESGPATRFAWDTVALMFFQVPIYAAIIFMGGADGAALLRGGDDAGPRATLRRLA